jgi:alanine racemase
MQTYRCWAEVDLTALRDNLAWLRRRVGPAVKIMTVVKADAYGHGLRPIAGCLMQSGTDIFGVANLAEARAIRAVGRGWPILLLGACLPDEVEIAVRDHVMPTLSSLAEASHFSAVARRLNRVVDVHVKVDTGMGRLGVAPAGAVELIAAIRRLSGIRLQGVFTHFAQAEDNAMATRRQAKCFQLVLDALARAGQTPPLVHSHNSAAVLHECDRAGTLVRPGLLIYGIVPPGRRRLDAALRAELRREVRPALSWKCRVALVKTVRAGTPLSYGSTFITAATTRVATVTAGYGDGFPRSASNRASVLVRGRRCRVLGRVTMDQMLVDVSRAGQVSPGDEVVLIGRQDGREIHTAELAVWAGTIPWETLTAITARVPRVYRGGEAS